MPQDSNAAVFELGTSGKGEIEVLSKLINPHIRVITDIQPAHLKGLQGMKGVAREKIQLLLTARDNDYLVLNAGNLDVWETLQGMGDRYSRSKIWAFTGISTGYMPLDSKVCIDIYPRTSLAGSACRPLQ